MGLDSLPALDSIKNQKVCDEKSKGLPWKTKRCAMKNQ